MGKVIRFLVCSLILQTTAWAAAPIGYFDGATCAQTWGWTCDADNWGTVLDIHFYADGPSGNGAFIGGTKANVSRPDVAGVCGGTTAHGFNLPPSPLVKLGDAHAIYAYALDPQGGPATLLTWSPRALTCPREVARAGLTYFGFHGQGGNLTYQAETPVNAALATSYTNVMHIGPDVSTFPSSTYIGNYLNDMRSRGARAIVGLSDILFCDQTVAGSQPQACSSAQIACPDTQANNYGAGCASRKKLTRPIRNNIPPGSRTDLYQSRWSLRSNWPQRWIDFLNAGPVGGKNSAYICNPTYVAALYIMDEPTVHTISATDLAAVTNYLAGFSAQCASIPRLIVESWPIIDRVDLTWPQLVIPATMSWVGFDDYGWRPLQNNPVRTPPYTSPIPSQNATLQKLKSLRTSSAQKILLVADTWWHPSDHHYTLANRNSSSNDPLVMAGVAVDYYNLARQDPDIIAVVGFHFPHIAKYGAREMIGKGSFPPDVPPPATWSTSVINNTYRLIGRSIAGDR
jgi:hypothetical protein